MFVSAVFLAFCAAMPQAAASGRMLHLCCLTIGVLAARLLLLQRNNGPQAVVATLLFYMIGTTVVAGVTGDARVVAFLDRYGSSGAYASLIMMCWATPRLTGKYFTEAYLTTGGADVLWLSDATTRTLSRRLSQMWTCVFVVCLAASAELEGSAGLAVCGAAWLCGLLGNMYGVRKDRYEGIGGNVFVGGRHG